MTTTKQTTNDKPAAAFVEVRGESGRLFGMLEVRTGVIHVQKGHAQDKIDLAKYAALVEGRHVALPYGQVDSQPNQPELAR